MSTFIHNAYDIKSSHLIQADNCESPLLVQNPQEERTIRDRTLLEVKDPDHRIPWKVRFNLGNSSRQITQCRNSIQGKTLLTDELGEQRCHQSLCRLTFSTHHLHICLLCFRLCLRKEGLAG